MKRSILAAFFIAAWAGGFKAFAYSPEAYPGSTWGNFTQDFNGVEGVGSQGYVNQAVQWLTLPGGVEAKTFAAYKWRLRSKNRTYYDAHGPSVGAEFSKYSINAGVDYTWQVFPELGTNSKNFEGYLSWYRKINLLKNSQKPSLLGIPVLGLPISTWGSLSRDLNDIEGHGAMGYVTLGVEWIKLPGDVILSTLGSYQWRFRDRNRRYYNVQGPGVAVELDRGPFAAGVEFTWRRYPELKESTRDFRFYLSWYVDWELKKLFSHTTP